MGEFAPCMATSDSKRHCSKTRGPTIPFAVNDWVKEQFEKPIETRSAPALEKSTVSKNCNLRNAVVLHRKRELGGQRTLKRTVAKGRRLAHDCATECKGVLKAVVIKVQASINLCPL